MNKEKKQIVTNILLYTLTAIVVVLFFAIVATNTVNIPFHDDFTEIINTANNWVESSTLSKEIETIFPYGDRLSFVMRLIVVMLYAVTGSINIAALTVIGNMFLLGMGILLFLIIKTVIFSNEQRIGKSATSVPISAVVISLLLYSGFMFGTSVWTTFLLSNVATVFLAFLSVILISKRGNSRFIAGIICASFAILTQGGGIALLPILAYILFSQKRKKELIILSGILTAIIIFYFSRYLDVNKNSLISHDGWWRKCYLFILDFFEFQGNLLSVKTTKIPAYFLGFFITGTFLYSCIKKSYMTNTVWFACFLYLLINAGMIVIGREQGSMSVHTGYAFYSSIFTIFTMSFYISKWKKAVNIIIVLLLITQNVYGMFLCYENTTQLTKNKIISAWEWNGKKEGLYMCVPSERHCYDAMTRAEKNNIFFMPKVSRFDIQKPDFILSFISKASIEKIEKYLVEEEYEKAGRTAEKILYTGAPKFSIRERITAADYLRLCLLKTESFNNFFYYYSEFSEMKSPLPTNNFLAKESILLELGYLFSSYDINIMMCKHDLKNELLWDIVKKNSLLCGRERFFSALQKGLKHKENKKSLDGWLSYAREKRQTTPEDTIMEQVNDIEAFLVLFFPVFRQNVELLEYYTLLVLFYKRLDLLPLIIERSKYLGCERLPDYVQEAVLLYAGKTGEMLVPKEEIDVEIKNQKGTYASYYFSN
ncbi:MAG: hypothetical protein LBG17_09530 [Bacteroidales bacterium]|jgi:hypothetical protein|nr:hypothetical protein [Bacteroidales bacterium]